MYSAKQPSRSQLLLAATILSVVLAVCAPGSAQKTIAASFQQQAAPSGSNPNSVYGGYQQSSSFKSENQNSLAAPAQRPRTQQTYVSRQQQSEVVRQPAYQQTQQISSGSSSYEQQSEADAEPASYGSVNGQPGQDFPAYTRVPKTSFTCDGLPYEYGMYADEETGCQAYHVCYNGRKDSFLCGTGTVFNQRILHCDYWYSVDCGKSSQYYSSNAYMGSSQPEPGPAQASGSQSSYKQTKVTQTSGSINRPAAFQRQPAASSSYQNTQQVQEEGY